MMQYGVEIHPNWRPEAQPRRKIKIQILVAETKHKLRIVDVTQMDSLRPSAFSWCINTLLFEPCFHKAYHIILFT